MSVFSYRIMKDSFFILQIFYDCDIIILYYDIMILLQYNILFLKKNNDNKFYFSKGWSWQIYTR